MVTCLFDENREVQIVDGYHVVLFLLSSLSRLSSVSVVFDFSVSLIVVFDENEKELVVGGCHLCVVSFVFTTQIECCDRCV